MYDEKHTEWLLHQSRSQSYFPFLHRPSHMCSSHTTTLLTKPARPTSSASTPNLVRLVFGQLLCQLTPCHTETQIGFTLSQRFVSKKMVTKIDCISNVCWSISVFTVLNITFPVQMRMCQIRCLRRSTQKFTTRPFVRTVGTLIGCGLKKTLLTSGTTM